MEVFSSVFIEGSKSFYNFTCSRLKIFSKYDENVRELGEEFAYLRNKKMEIEEHVTLARMEEKTPKPQVIEWLKKVSKVEDSVRSLLEIADEYADGRGYTMLQQYQQCCKVAKKLDLVKELNSIHFETVAPEGCSPIKAVEEMSVPFLVGQRAVLDRKEILGILHRNDVKRIAVWGKGGVGKTTLVKNVSNELCFFYPNLFDIVIWVQVSRALDVRAIQAQIAKRIHLKVEAEDAQHRIASRILRRLKLRKKILVILDDVWEEVDLDAVGVPSRDPCCKVLFTTRSRNVCRHMNVNVSLQLNLMSEEDAWDLFVRSVGPVVDQDGIESPARKIVAGFHGLPLAIKTLGKSMRDRPQIELWQNACLRWSCSSPLFKNVENEVFGTLAMSYYSLPNKILKQCFLYCSMYPGSFSIDFGELIKCWVSDGLINENQSVEQAFNYGVSLIEHIKDLCLLDHDSEGTVKMHDIFRHLAIFLSQSQQEFGFHCQLDLPFYQTPNESSRRVSFMGCNMKKLHEFPVNSQLTVLFLQGNPIEKIPNEFFHNVKSLRVLNLSETQITALPSSFLCLRELRSLFLRGCCLENLPSLRTLPKLLTIDLSKTRIRELPKGFESLCNLRELNLSSTYFLKKIAAGSFSGLSSLQTLDMSSSAYNWNSKMSSYQRAMFDELLSLNKLSVLNIRLDSIECLAFASSWLKKLRRYDIQISPRSCDSNHHVAKHNEKRLVFRGVDLLQEDLQDLLQTTSSLDMITCVGMKQRHWLSLSSLVSLTLSNCDAITCLVSRERSSREMFPNLQHLVLDHLKNLETTVDGIHSRGKLFINLKTLHVLDCPRLGGTISYAMLRHVQELSEIKVSGCENMSCIIEPGEHEGTLPNLRVLEISNMVNLSTICDRTSVFPVLERIEVSRCFGVKKLPVSISNLSSMKEIRGDLKWWNNLEWEDDSAKNFFLQYFQAYPQDNCSRKKSKYK